MKRSGLLAVTLQDVYAHWREGDWTPAFDFYADDFEWGWSDEFPGLAGVFKDTRTPNPRLQSWLCGWDSWTCEAEDYVQYGDVVVALTRYRGRGRGSGVEVDTEGAHVWTLRDGKATRLEVFADPERALRVAADLVEDLVDEPAFGS
jgi:ketosteroid isomerase-like protein